MMYKIPDELLNQVIVLDDNDFRIKQIADDLNVSQGWDRIPPGNMGASIMCYRGPHIYYFQKKAEAFPGEKNCYQLIQFKDYKKFNGLEEIAWEMTEIQFARPRLAGYIYHNN